MDVQRLRDLLAINRAITESLDYDEVLDLIMEKTAAFIEADGCLLVTADEHGRESRI